MKPNSNPMEPKARLLGDPDITEAIQTTRAALAEYGAFVLQQEDRMFPSHAVVRLEKEITASMDASSMASKLALMRELDSKAASAVAEGVKRQAMEVFEPARAALVGLMKLAIDKLESWAVECALAEKEFFASWGVKDVPSTEVRGRYVRELARLTSLLNEWGVRPTVLPKADGTPLQTFFCVALLG